MGDVVYLDGRHRLRQILHDAIVKVEKGEFVAIAVAAVTESGCLAGNWASSDAPSCSTKQGSHVGGTLLRASVYTMVAQMEQTQSDVEIDDDRNPDSA